jgi:hypothetical protein
MGCQREPGENLAVGDFDTRRHVAVMTLHEPPGAFSSGPHYLDLEAVARQFYCTHGHVFQFLTVFTTFGLGNESRAFYQPVRNDVQGLGPSYGEFDFSETYASRGALEGFLVMKALSQWSVDSTLLGVLGHEFGHRWCCRVRYQHEGTSTPSDALLDDLRVHWSDYVDSNASVMGGADWKPSGRGERLVPTAYRTGYSDLDLYLMGLYRPQEVRPFFYLAEPSYEPTRGWIGTKTRVSIEDIIRGSGPRVPPARRRGTVFRQAFVLVTTAEVGVTRDEVRKMERIVKAWRKWFRRATHGRARIDTSLRTRGS